MRTRRLLLPILFACALSAGAAACGSSGTSSASSPAASASATSAAPSSSADTQKVIAANWTAFFNAKTPVAKRVSLLQDGQAFSSIISAQAGTGLAAQASAKVTKVTLQSSAQAEVTYSILLDGQSALANQQGFAVYQNGVWKVGVGSFCGLLTLENGGKSSSLPAACKTAG